MMKNLTQTLIPKTVNSNIRGLPAIVVKLLYLLFFTAALSACNKNNAAKPATKTQGDSTKTTNLADTIPPKIQWAKCFGGDQSDNAFSVQPTADGGYIMAGNSNSTNGDVTGNHGENDYWVVKIDNNGIKQWEKSYGGSSDDNAKCIIQTSDGGYIIGGETGSTDGDAINNTISDVYNTWLLKLDATGNIQWQKFLPLNIQGGQINAVQQTAPDKGYIVVGTGYYLFPTTSYSDIFVMKLSTSGDTQWTQVLGGDYEDNGYAVQQTADGGYVVAGSTASHNGAFSITHGSATFDYYIAKLNAGGTLQWQQIYGGSDNDEANAIKQTTDGGYIVSGYAKSTDGDVAGNHGGSDFWLLKLNPAGGIQWKSCFGGEGDEEAFDVIQTADGGYVAGGYTIGSGSGEITDNHNGGTTDIWLTKVNSKGTLMWKKCYGGGSWEDAYALTNTADGGFLVAGDTFSTDGDVSGNHGGYDYWAVKFKSN